MLLKLKDCLRNYSKCLLFFSFSKTYRPLLSEGTLSRSILHNYTARDASSGKYATYEVTLNAFRELEPFITLIDWASQLEFVRIFPRILRLPQWWLVSGGRCVWLCSVPGTGRPLPDQWVIHRHTPTCLVLGSDSSESHSHGELKHHSLSATD